MTYRGACWHQRPQTDDRGGLATPEVGWSLAGPEEVRKALMRYAVRAGRDQDRQQEGERAVQRAYSASSSELNSAEHAHDPTWPGVQMVGRLLRLRIRHNGGSSGGVPIVDRLRVVVIAHSMNHPPDVACATSACDPTDTPTVGS